MKRSSMFTSMLFAFIVFTIFTSRSHAQTTINVACNTADFVAAINTANGTPAADTLNLAAGCAYNFTVGDAVNTDSALPLITSPILINGNGATIARTGGPSFRLFFVHGGGNLTLNDVLVSGGSEGNGGGIVVNIGATMTLTNSAVSGNNASVRGGGVLVETGALLTAINSTISGNSAGFSGGGINNSGTLNVVKSMLAGNNGGSYGGGINNNGGTVSVVNTTISGSSASNGAGIYSTGGLTVTNATLSGNSAGSGAGMYVATGSATIFNSTLAGNWAGFGGGIFILSASVTVANSIIWGNNQAVFNNSGSFTINFSDIQGGAGGAGNWSIDPLFVNPVSPASAPTTAGDYHLQSISPVINGGNNAALPADTFDLDGDSVTAEPIPYDRDGEARIMLGNLDIGADEVTPCLAFTSPYTVSAGDEADLIFAIQCANANPDTSVINLTLGTYSFAVGDNNNTDSALPRITTPITINGNGATLERAGGSPAFRLFYIDTSGSLTLNTTTITGGNSANGGGIYNDGITTVTNSTISGHSATNGGGIYNNGGATLTVTGSTLTSNTAAQSGGGIVSGSVLNVANSTFSGNSASNGGGILSNNAGTLTVTGSTLSSNSASVSGGGINSGGTLTVTGSTLTSNNASYGSGIYMDGTALVTSSTLSGNSAGSGGAIYNNGGATLTVTNSLISGNSAGIDGGGIVSGGVLTVTSSTLAGNKAGINGGGIYSNNAGTLTVTNSIVWGNNTQIQSGGTTSVFFSDVQGGFAGTGNLAADPLFVSPIPYSSAPTTAGDYRLQANSPALNGGSNAALPADTQDLDGDSNTAEALPVDLDGNPRVVNATVDMGAFEHQVAADIIISETGADVTEGGATDTYTVRLASRPAADVTVDISSGGQATANPDPLTFTPSNWATEQTVTISAVDDDVAESAHGDSIAHSANSTDLAYDGITVSSIAVAISDNDIAGVQVSEVSVDVTEGGSTGNYTIVLTSEPTASVIVTPTGDLQCAVSAPLTFTSANWDTPQPVTVTAIDDDVAEVVQTCTITHASVSSDTNYSGIAVASVTGDITDNDIAGVQINVTSVDVSEGGTTGIYTIVLKSEPTADVIVTPTGDLQCTVSAALTFTSADWDTPQPVTVTAVDDDVAEGEHNCTITNVAGGSDLTYGNMPIAGVNGTITDNDTAGVTVAPFNVIVAEGGDSALYAVSLQSQPTADVTITPTGDADCAVGSSVTFSSTNWMNTQDIVVTAIDDAIAEGSHGCFITNAASSSDMAYDSALVDSVSGTITDNDTAGVNVAPTTVNISEDGATATFAVSLTSQPTSDVTVTPTGDADCSVSAARVFTSENWMTAQDITVTAIDDAIAEGSHSCTITNAATSGDANYDGIAVSSVSGTITDNDTAGVNVAPTTVNVSEAGDTATFAVSLTSQPTADVTVTPTGDVDCSVSAALIFTSGNWMTTQDITVTAIDDAIAEGSHSCNVTHAVTSADLTYNGISVGSVDGSITDNDTAGVNVEPTVAVAEGGAADTYGVVLTSKPISDVTITPSGDSQCTVGSAITFTDADWDTPQFIMVTAMDDAVAEGNHNCSVTHAAASADLTYDAISIASVTGSITDDDPFPAELLVNAGMELHTVINKIPDGWTVSNATLDKLLCKPGKPHSGLCAFGFAGNVGEKGQLSQTVNLSGVTADAGDTLTLSAYFKGNDTTAKTQMHLIVTYSGNPTPVRSKITVRRNATYTLVSLPAMQLTGPVEKIKVMFKHKSTAGKVLIDDVSLIHTIPGGRGSDALPPSEVDGFRGAN